MEGAFDAKQYDQKMGELCEPLLHPSFRAPPVQLRGWPKPFDLAGLAAA